MILSATAMGTAMAIAIVGITAQLVVGFGAASIITVASGFAVNLQLQTSKTPTKAKSRQDNWRLSNFYNFKVSGSQSRWLVHSWHELR